MQRIIDSIARFFVGGLLIFSGLIKLNDPIGTAIKMEEYFEVFSKDFGSLFRVFIPWSLEIGFFMIVLEIALGIAILIYWRMAFTAWLLLAMMLFFTFLTFYSAYFNKVTDCGCFGDAIKLTPWQSFWKDIIIMVFVAHLFWYRRRYVPVLRTREGHAVMLVATVASVYAGVYAINHLPFIDFRAYKVGSHIPTRMLPPEQPVIEFTFEKDGKPVVSRNYIMDSAYRYVSSRVVNADRIKPKITDYAVTSPDGEDKTQSTFSGNLLFVVLYDVATAGTQNIDAIRSLTAALENRVDCVILTASGAEQVDAFRHRHQLALPFYFVDATVLKTMIRANPGISLWKNGTVLGNWHHNDTPAPETVLQLVGG
jgi:uncharacterized membrane protein YphA (DoxX/SURF4 family)